MIKALSASGPAGGLGSHEDTRANNTHKERVALLSAVDLTVVMQPGFLSDRYFCAQRC